MKQGKVEVAKTGKPFGKFFPYKYRVIGRNGFVIHHTNDPKDAHDYLEKCRKYWRENK